jgi:hypothetical protein
MKYGYICIMNSVGGAASLEGVDDDDEEEEEREDVEE